MNSKKRTYTAVIIGAGRIASDFDAPRAKHVLTYAHALSLHPRIIPCGIIDTDTQKGKRAGIKWKIPYLGGSTLVLDELEPDIVIIATPDRTHAPLLMRLLAKRIPLIICEKPVATDKKELSRLSKAAVGADNVVLVNFSRRYDPVVQKVRKELIEGRFGRVISANGIYTNGTAHNGSHLFDLARFFFGEMRTCKGVFQVNDHGSKDPSVSGFATFERCPQFSILTGDERSYAMFELEIITEKRRLRFANYGFELISQDRVPDPMFKGFTALSAPKSTKTGLARAMEYLIDHAVDVLDKKVKPLTTLCDGIKTQEACIALSTSVKQRS